MFHRDTLRLIKKTFKRFLTIFLIVFIGVSFMVGLFSIGPIMRESVDKYYDELNFMDVQLYSSYGFSQKDIDVIKKAKNVEDVTPTKFVDAFTSFKDEVYVTRVQEVDTQVNQFELISGRMPNKPNEALTLGSASFGTVFEEGTTIRLYLEDSDLSESLSNVEYEIVGTVRSPQYMASSKETSTLNNLGLSAIIYVDNDNFLSDIYTSMYVTFENSKDYTSFTDDYKDFITQNIEILEESTENQQDSRRLEIIAELEEEIKKGELEMEEQFSEAQKQIDDGYLELNKGYYEILNGQREIEKNEKKLLDGEKELEAGRAQLNAGLAEIENAKKMITDKTGKSFEESIEMIESLKDTYKIVEVLVANTDVEDRTDSLNDRLSENREEIRTLRDENKQYEKELGKLEDNILNTFIINAYKFRIEINNMRITSLQAQNDYLVMVIDMYGSQPLDKLLDLLDELSGGDIDQAYEGILQIQRGEAEINAGFAQLKRAEAELEAGRVEIEKVKALLSDGQFNYDQGVEQLVNAQKQLDEEYEKARIEIEKARQQLDEIPTASWMMLDRDSHYSTAMYDGNAQQMQKIGTVFPFLFFLVAALVCMTTMKRLVDEERSQIGVFSALGFTKRKITNKYVFYAFSASIIGSLLGTFAGIPVFPPVIYFCWKLMYDLPDIQLSLPISAALAGILSFTLLMMIVTYFVARGSLKEMPSQLMRPKAPKTAKKVFLEKISFIWNHLSFTSKVTARNLIRYKSRFFMTVIGVAGCTSLLVLGFGIKDSISQVLSIQYGEIMKFDYTISLEEHKYTEELVEELEDDDHEFVAPFMTYSSKVYLDEEETISVHVIDEDYDSFVDLRERVSQEVLELDDGVIISEKFAKNHNIQVGDEIKIESKSGLKEEFEVTGICEMYFQHFLFISKDTYEDYFNETVYNDKIAVRTSEEDFSDDIANISYVDSVTDFTEVVATFESMIEALDIIVIVILLAAGSLAFVVLMNLTEVNISERMREIATLKVLGFNDKEVNSYIFKEIFLLTLIGSVFGLPLGKLELGYVMNIINMEMVMFGNQVEPLSYLYGFMITQVFAVIVLLFMRGSLRKVQMVESLKSVE